jgi:hypothetical protein
VKHITKGLLRRQIADAVLSEKELAQLHEDGFVLLESKFDGDDLISLANHLGHPIPPKPGSSIISDL